MSEVSFSKLKAENGELRIEAEHFQKKYSDLKRKLSYHNCARLAELVSKPIQTGHTPSMKNERFYGGNIKFIKTDNLRDNDIKFPFSHYLSELGNSEIRRTELQENDIITTIIGATYDVIARSCIIHKEILPANINQNIAHIRPNTKKIIPEYLNMYLNSKYGKMYLEYLSRQMEQVNLNCEEVGNVLVPLFSTDFQKKIESLVKSAHTKLSESKSLYAQAEDTLLSELDLKDWQPKNEAVSIKPFSDFASIGRLDAEYYQSKYDELFEKLSKFPQIKIKDIINYPVSSGSTPKAGDSEYYSDEKTGIPFLRAVDIIQSRIDLNDLMYIKSRVHNGLLKRTQLHKGDVLFSIAGTVGRCGIFDYDFEANINQAIAILRFDESVVKHLYVIQFFNSKIGQLVIEKYARQGLQTNLNLEELSNLPIPILPQETQKQIAELIQTSFALRQESKQLLESAKLAVEAEIER